MERPKELFEHFNHLPNVKPINPDWDRPHRMGMGFGKKDFSWEICGCGYEAPSLDAHTAIANTLTEKSLKALDEAKHISYWCGIHDHCCCTDVDWDICNCACHKDDDEERYCRKRLSRWRRARREASKLLAEDSL